MKIFLATYGSRGDFEPFLNFANFSASKGHQVILTTTAEFATRVNNPLIQTKIVAGAIQDLISKKLSFFQLLKQFNDTIKPDTVKMFNQVADLIQLHKPDLVLYHPKVLSAPIAAKSVGAKACLVEMIPLSTPTKEFGIIPGLGRSNYGIFNKLTFKLIQLSATVFKKDLVQIFKRFGENNINPDCYLCLVSNILVKQPTDWPKSAHLVGPWLAKASNEELDVELDKFLEKPTIYVGFGSMSDAKFSKRVSQISEAIIEMGYQVLLVTGWGSVDSNLKISDPKKILIRNSVPHSKVFPKVLVAIHHGGAGTVHATLINATPSVIVPFIADQRWWAQNLYEKNLGPKPLGKNRLSNSKLQKAIRHALESKPKIAESSIEFGKTDPMANSLAILENLVAKK